MIGIIGFGVLGKAMAKVLGGAPAIYDPAAGYPDDSVLDDAELIFVCVPTPMDFSTGEVDLSCVRDAVSRIGSGKTVVIRSTVPPGTTDALQRERPDLSIHFVPEFLREKHAFYDAMYPTRIVIGSCAGRHLSVVTEIRELEELLAATPEENVIERMSLEARLQNARDLLRRCGRDGRGVPLEARLQNARDLLAKLPYTREASKARLNNGQVVDIFERANPRVPIITTDAKTAEMYKYACNCLLAFQIAAANEIERISDALGVDYDLLRGWFQFDARLGTMTQVPGHDGQRGFGGKCFPKDCAGLLAHSNAHGYDAPLLRAMIDFNNAIREEKDWLNIPGAVSVAVDGSAI